MADAQHTAVPDHHPAGDARAVTGWKRANLLPESPADIAGGVAGRTAQKCRDFQKNVEKRRRMRFTPEFFKQIAQMRQKALKYVEIHGIVVTQSDHI